MAEIKNETGCCPRFDPEPWDDKEINWDKKPFVKGHVNCVFNIPLNFGQAMKKGVAKLQEADALPKDMLMLSDCKSPWSLDVYIAATKDVPDVKMEHISGRFLTKVYEGAYKDMGKWINDMDEYVKAKGQHTKKLYQYYTTCPKCAKVYGKNPVVLLAQVA